MSVMQGDWLTKHSRCVVQQQIGLMVTQLHR